MSRVHSWFDSLGRPCFVDYSVPGPDDWKDPTQLEGHLSLINDVSLALERGMESRGIFFVGLSPYYGSILNVLVSLLRSHP